MLDIKTLGGDEATDELEKFIVLLTDAVNHGAAINFVAPLQREIAVNYWQDVFKAVSEDGRVLLGAYLDDVLVGTVQLQPAWQPNGRHRVELMKLVVHTQYRRQGIASQLMQASDDAAKAINRSLIVLDTRQDDNGELLYQKAGYTAAGVIPGFALNPDGKGKHATVYYYKHLDE